LSSSSSLSWPWSRRLRSPLFAPCPGRPLRPWPLLAPVVPVVPAVVVLIVLAVPVALVLVPRCRRPCACHPLVLASSRLPIVVPILGGGCPRCPRGALWPLSRFHLPRGWVPFSTSPLSILSRFALASSFSSSWSCPLLVLGRLSSVSPGPVPSFCCSCRPEWLGRWRCVSLRHPAVVAAVLPVSRGGGVVSGRWRRWGRFVCLPCR
jgi:hypothetical protein